jgi:hypothetical protein
MDRINDYHNTVQELVRQYAADWKPRDGTRVEAVTDPEHGHYQIVRTGWKGSRFIDTCLVHFAIRGREVQLLKNDTEVEWDRELIDRGVAPEDIVLTFRHPVREGDTLLVAEAD